MSIRSLISTGLSLALLLFIGCQGEESSSSPEQSDLEPAAPMPVAAAVDGKPEVSIVTLRKRLGANSKAEFNKAGGLIIAASLAQSGVTDITPLSGLPMKYLDLTLLNISDLAALAEMPLEELYLEGTKVKDLSPLKGMPLRILRMEQTPVEDLSALAGMKLERLNVFGTQVKDISVVAGMPLNTLWLTDSKVEDISVLKGMKLESLDLEKTAVADLSPIAGNVNLQRLNIAESNVTDLTPLKGLNINRLIFSPEKITKGIEVIRSMPSLQKIGPTFDEVVAPAQFWAEWDAKQAAPKTEPKAESKTEPKTKPEESLIGINVIPIAGLFGGDFLCLDYRQDINHPTVGVWDHELSDELSPHITQVADSFSDFTSSLMP